MTRTERIRQFIRLVEAAGEVATPDNPKGVLNGRLLKEMAEERKG